MPLPHPAAPGDRPLTPSPSGAPASPTRRQEAMVLLVASAAQFMVVLDLSVVNVAMPSIGRELHYSNLGLQWVANAYILTFAGFLLLGGRIADLFGRRHAFLAGLGVFAGASVLAGTAQSSMWLTGARALQGVGSAVLAPATLTIVVTSFSGARLGRAIGVWSAVASVGGAAGVFLGGVITAGLGWRWIFFINVPIGVIVAAVALTFLTERRQTAGGRGLDLPGAITVTGGLALLAYSIVSTDQYSWGSAHTLVCLVGAVALIGVFAVVQLRSRRPLVPLRLFRSRWVTGANAVVVLMGGWTFVTWYFFSLYLQDVVGYSPLRTGLGLAPMAAAIAVAAQVSSRLALPHLGVRRTVQLALAVGIASFIWLSALNPTGRYWAGLFGAGMLVSVSQGLLWTPLVAAATGGVDPAEAGLASGILNNSRQVGGSIGLAALVTLAAARSRELAAHGATHGSALTGGFARAYLVAAGLAVLALGLSLLLPGRPARRSEPAQELTTAAEAVPSGVEPAQA